MSHTSSHPFDHLFKFDIKNRKLKNKSHNGNIVQPHSSSYEKSCILLDETDFECILCFRLYYQPVTLVCGNFIFKN